MDVFTLALTFFSLLFVAILRWKLGYMKKSLPPGTMGWPVFGENIKFINQGPKFIEGQRKRYGSLFKTHILGCPTVISVDSELNRFILMNESKGLVPGYPTAMLNILGKRNIAAIHGLDHKLIRGSLLDLIKQNTFKEQIIPKIDRFMRNHLSKWENKVIDLQRETKEMILLSALNQVVGTDFSLVSQVLMKEFFIVFNGTMSLPINLPGTSYWRGLQARKNIVKIFGQLMEKRRNDATPHADMLDRLMSDEIKHKLNKEEIIDQIITILNSGFETVSVTSMMSLKFLHDHPKFLQELTDEHLAIREKKKPEDPLHFDDIKSMHFTRAVIMETMRLATVVNGPMRKTIHDVELNGYVIPKGWRIYVYTRDTNYDPLLHVDPLSFNPRRWQDNSLESRKNFFLFGAGSRLCPGKELGIVEISFFLHYFLTKYRYNLVEECKIIEFPRVQALNGLRIRVSSY